MGLEEIASVTITANTLPSSRTGFSTILAAVYHSEFTDDLIRSYRSLTAVAEDFPPEHPAYLMAQRMLSQKPRPKQIKIGRRTAAPAQSVKLTPTITTEGHVYKITIHGTDIEYTVPSGASVATICTAITALINAATGLFTATDNTTHITVTADTSADVDAIITTHASSASSLALSGTDLNGVIGAGTISPGQKVTLVLNSHADWDATTAVIVGRDRWGDIITENLAIPDNGNTTLTTTNRFSKVTSLTIPAQSGTSGSFTLGIAAPVGSLFDFWPKSAGWTLQDITADPGLANDLDDLREADADWYGLALDSNSEAEINIGGLWAEAQDAVLFGWNTADSGAKSSSSTTDIASDMDGFGYARSPGIWNARLLSYAGAAMLAEHLTHTPGSATAALKTLIGVTADNLTDTEIDALNDKHLNHYTTRADKDIVRKGWTPSGEYIDVTVFLDWLRIGMQEDVIALLTSVPKVPYTQKGAEQVAAVVLARLKLGASPSVGGIDGEQPITVTVPDVVEDVPLEDRQNRHLPQVEFSARLAGAIHTVDINGTVSV